MSNIINAIGDFFTDSKRVTAYPTYAYRRPREDDWTVPVKVWVHKRRETDDENRLVRYYFDRLWADGSEATDDGDSNSRIARLKRLLQGLRDPPPLPEGSEDEFARFKDCLADFVADDDFNEPVSVRFDGDGETYDLSRGTDLNGLVQEDLRVPDAKMRELLRGQAALDGEDPGWLRLTAVSDKAEGSGRVRVMFEDEGLSVVSDIDDTIKVTEVPAGKAIVLRNTFLREYAHVPEMLDRYQNFRGELAGQFGGVSFHYVSGSPWQLFRLLKEFLVDKTGFPEGTFHMKDVRKNLLDPQSWRDIKNFIAGREATMQQKLNQIRELMRNLPRRKFILIGDSGERDPEVFREIKRDPQFAPQVHKVIIRHVLEERWDAGDEVIVVDPPIRHGVSLLDRT